MIRSWTLAGACVPLLAVGCRSLESAAVEAQAVTGADDGRTYVVVALEGTYERGTEVVVELAYFANRRFRHGEFGDERWIFGYEELGEELLADDTVGLVTVWVKEKNRPWGAFQTSVDFTSPTGTVSQEELDAEFPRQLEQSD